MAFSNSVNDITVKGYKSIKHLDKFRFSNLNVMIGSNGAGKSNFISLFKLLNEIAEGRFQSYIRKVGGAHTLLYFGQESTHDIEVNVDFGPNSYTLKLEATTDDSLYFKEEDCFYLGAGYAHPYNHSALSDDRKESGLTNAAKKSQVVASVRESILSWKLYHFHDTSDAAALKKMGPLGDNEKFKPDASNLAAYLYLLENKYSSDFNNITDTIRLIAPFFNGFNLRPSPLNPESIQLEWRHKHSENYFNASSLSDGTLRFICLATLLLQPEVKLPKTILLDEPELGLHPAAIQLLASLLQGAATKTQVIVSTQSVTLVNQLKPESIIIADRNDDCSSFRRLTPQELEAWVDDYGLGDMWEKNVIGGRP